MVIYPGYDRHSNVQLKPAMLLEHRKHIKILLQFECEFAEVSKLLKIGEVTCFC